MGSQIGVAIAAVAMIGGTEILRELDWLKYIFGNDFDPTQYRMLLFGLAMVADHDLAPARPHLHARSPPSSSPSAAPSPATYVKEGHG